MTYVGEDLKWTQILGSQPISKKNNFSIRILQTKYKAIGVGVINCDQKNLRDTDYNDPYYFFYDGRGNLYGGGKGFFKKQGKGFDKGDVVTVKVSA